MRRRAWTSTELLENRGAREEIYARYPLCDRRVLAYVEDVLRGGIDACEKIRLACLRTVSDLAREPDPDCRWRFDQDKACRPIRFIEKFARVEGGSEPMVLMPWQCWVVASLFGFVDKQTGERKYNYLLLVVGSGNGKTPLVAAIALYLASQEGVHGAEIDMLANSRQQASILLRDCRTMIDSSPAMRERFRGYADRIEYFSTREEARRRGAMPVALMQVQSSNARGLDGLRPTAALFDEIHEQTGYDLMRQMRRSLDKRPNALLLMFSTMGYVLDGLLVSEYRLADQLLKGSGNPEVNERRLAIIYEMDAALEPKDSAHWGQANPSLGVLLDMERLRLRWQEGLAVPEVMLDFLTKQLNLFTRVSSLSYLSWELIERNRDTVDLEQIRGREAYGGFDISTSYDHTGAALVIPLDDGREVVIFHAFVPRRVAEANAEKLDYYAWAMQGDLTIIDGDYVNQSYIIDWFEKWAEVFDIRVIGYDPANATLLVRSLSSWRGEGKPVFACEPVRQGALTLNAPMKDLKERFMDGKIVYNRSGLFEWYLNNVKLRKDYATRDNENYVPVKLDKYSKIDVFMAFLDAHTIWMRKCPAPGAMAADAEVEFIDLGDSGDVYGLPEPGMDDFWGGGGHVAL